MGEFTTIDSALRLTGRGPLAWQLRPDKAMEIDCYPDRQDLNVDLLAVARTEGCGISLGTDSHGPFLARLYGPRRGCSD